MSLLIVFGLGSNWADSNPLRLATAQLTVLPGRPSGLIRRKKTYRLIGVACCWKERSWHQLLLSLEEIDFAKNCEEELLSRVRNLKLCACAESSHHA